MTAEGGGGQTGFLWLFETFFTSAGYYVMPKVNRAKALMLTKQPGLSQMSWFTLAFLANANIRCCAVIFYLLSPTSSGFQQQQRKRSVA